MSRKLLGVGVPLAITVFILGIVGTVSAFPSVKNGIRVGLAIAFLQSVVSVLALDWAWEKKFVYWVWGGGMFFRMAVFVATAFTVYQSTSLNFVSTMVSMVTATTVFLVVESYLFFGKR